LKEELFLQAQVLIASLNLVTPPQHDLLAHKHLLHSLVFRRAKEYFRATCVLTPLSPTSTYANTTLAVFTLHPQLDGFLPLFLEDSKPN
jgi:hypothetical protein